MATSLTYAFNQARLLALINRPGCETVVLSLVNLIKSPHTEAYLYIYAQAHDGEGVPIIAQDIAGAGGEEACPVPPGWQCDNDPPSIQQSQLELAPRFSIAKELLLPVVEQNNFEMIGVNASGQPEMMKQVLVYLEGEITDEGLEPFISLTSQNKNGTYIMPAVKAHSFTPGLLTATIK